ncbi:hypothetical protein U9R90_05425 [Streptomyces sp. E11-3]|uniref:hypothetical protein n=1 Tax=Streptomyces sp. E11-3 TaxID=3110112 RepID=UPI003980A40C
MNAVDAFFAATQVGKFLWLLAPGVAAVACWRLLRRAWDRARWAWTARRAARGDVPAPSAIEGLEQLEDHLAAEWARLQPYYADERGNQ